VTETNLIILIAFSLFLILLLGLLPGKQVHHPPEEASDAILQTRLFSIAADLEMPASWLAARISDRRDWEFISREAPRLKNSFLKERKRVAIAWLRETRKQMSRLLLLHRIISRTSTNLRIGTELSVAWGFLSFQTLLMIAQGLILLFGPFHLQRLAGSIVATFEEVTDAVSSAVPSLDSVMKTAIRSDWARYSNREI